MSPFEPLPASPDAATAPNLSISPEAWLASLDRAVAKLAPLWPLDHFVAVNPFVGLADRHFSDAALELAEAAGARLTMPRRFYAEALARGELDPSDLREAIAELGLELGLDLDGEALLAALRHEPEAIGWDPLPACRPTVAELATRITGVDWSGRLVDAISSWAAGYFDEGQAAWADPWRERSPFAAWRAAASLDRGPELLGLVGFRERVAAVPERSVDAAAWAIATLGLEPAALDRPLDRLARTLAGWAGYARYQGWAASQRGEPDTRARELLIVRLVWDALLLELGDPRVGETWAAAREQARRQPESELPPELARDLALHRAYERGAQRRLLAPLPARGAATLPIQRFAQAVFCIDVRSEPVRRILEQLDPGIETRGFAGFFGVALDYRRLGLDRGEPRCPVLVEPSVVVTEATDASERARARRQRQHGRDGVWASFKQAAVSSFTYVEAAGLTYALKLVGDSLGLTRPVASPATHGLDLATAASLRPSLAGLDLATRIRLAEGMLRAMSIDDFAPLVVLFGHSATTVNNPHASGLDCGACGGHGGDANARVAAAILNDPEVRAALAERGRAIPATTWFVAGLHDTTTDALTLFDTDAIPASHRWELERLSARLAAASPRARARRAAKLGLAGAAAETDAAVLARSRDWAETRPEWGLANCAALVIAPRRRTRGLDLDGRVFLHDYAWQRDEGFGVLETLLTAPMIVASWISLQYYASTVDPRVFGAGDKRVHDVVAQAGVREGRHGDLRVGLPWQSVHDGEGLIHAPLRLSVVVEAPREAIDAVLDAHPGVRDLVVHAWLDLFALTDEGALLRWTPAEPRWRPFTPAPS